MGFLAIFSIQLDDIASTPWRYGSCIYVQASLLLFYALSMDIGLDYKQLNLTNLTLLAQVMLHNIHASYV